jgi:Tol biopolymer transport system component
VDVALNIVIEIVFSEPIDRTSVTPASLRLLKGQVPVGGSIQISADGLVAQFTPVNDLDASAAYSLLLTSAVRDLDGDPLEDPPAVEFTTAAQPLHGMIAFVSSRDGNPEIYTSNVDGTDIRRLTNTVFTESDPEWSPDGTRLVFSRSGTGPSSESDIYIMDADGSNVVQLTDGGINFQPSWSPDGSRVAYVVDQRSGGQTRIRVQRIGEDVSTSTYVGYDTGWNTDPAWSPDGVFIVFATDWYLYDFATQLVKVRADGSAPATLLPLAPPWNLGTYYLQPSWHGSSIAFAECDWFYVCGGPGSITVTDRDGFTQRRLIQASNIWGTTWSPDGAFIAYSAQTCRECTPPSIYYISVDGKDKGLMVSNAYSPSWRPVPR